MLLGARSAPRRHRRRHHLLGHPRRAPAGLDLKQLYLVGAGPRRPARSRARSTTAGWPTARSLLYLLSVVALVYVLLLRPAHRGHAALVVIGGFQIQPSEFAKLVAALLRGQGLRGVQEGEPGPARHRCGPARPSGCWSLLIARRARPRHRLLPACRCSWPWRSWPACACGRVAGARWRCWCSWAGWAGSSRSRTTRRRASTPSSTRASTRAGAGYQKIQSQIAVGSGGLVGQGLQEGQPEPARLPARAPHRLHLLGAGRGDGLRRAWWWCSALYLLVLWRVLETAQLARDRVGAFLAAGDGGGLRVPGRVQCRHGGGARARQGAARCRFMSYGGSSVVFIRSPSASSSTCACGASPTEPVARSLRPHSPSRLLAAPTPPASPWRPAPLRGARRRTAGARDGSWKGPSMTKDLIVSSTPQETRVALLEDGVVSEIFIEREAHRGIVGNIYKGRVTRVLPGMQSAFVDLGLERDAFLYVGRRASRSCDENLLTRRGAGGSAARARAPPSRSGSTRARSAGAGGQGAARDRRARASPPTSRCPAATWCSCPPSSTWASRARSSTTRSGAG